MSIENHVFADESLSFGSDEQEGVYIYVDDKDDPVLLMQSDAEALARHFNLIPDQKELSEKAFLDQLKEFAPKLVEIIENRPTATDVMYENGALDEWLGCTKEAAEEIERLVASSSRLNNGG